ncbi:muscarinic acetylcholine receptor M2-like [Ptychodera flava]|uniref:muscarinic acetylcholine receptor M2-like n=1 Tax=Ptychodera flava TaxID=63121 RepID=UPI00396A3263
MVWLRDFAVNNTLSANLNWSEAETNETLVYFDGYDDRHLLWLLGIGIGGGLFSFLVVFSNVLVIFIFRCNRQLRKVTYNYIINLAVADFIVGFVSVPGYIVYVSVGYWPFGRVSCEFWLFADYLVSNVNLYTIIVICVDRYKSLIDPLKHRTSITSTRVHLTIAGIWVMCSTMHSVPNLLWPRIRGFYEFSAEECTVEFKYHSWFVWTRATLGFWSPLVILVILYARIYNLASKVATRKRSERQNTDVERKPTPVVISGKGKHNSGRKKSLPKAADHRKRSTPNNPPSPKSERRYFVGELEGKTVYNDCTTSSTNVLDCESVIASEICSPDASSLQCDHQTCTTRGDENNEFPCASGSAVQTGSVTPVSSKHTCVSGSSNSAVESVGCEKTKETSEERFVAYDNPTFDGVADEKRCNSSSKAVISSENKGESHEGSPEVPGNNTTKLDSPNEDGTKGGNDEIVESDLIDLEAAPTDSTITTSIQGQLSTQDETEAKRKRRIGNVADSAHRTFSTVAIVNYAMEYESTLTLLYATAVPLASA